MTAEEREKRLLKGNEWLQSLHVIRAEALKLSDSMRAEGLTNTPDQVVRVIADAAYMLRLEISVRMLEMIS